MGPTSPGQRFSPVGRCIYCGSEKHLSDEHIIPFALDGNWVLPKASCRGCARITGALERDILRGPLLAARTRAGYQTRNPRNRPKELPMQVLGADGHESGKVPVPDHLTLLTLPLLLPPAHLDQRVYERGVDLYGTETILFGDQPAELAERLDAKRITVSGTYNFVDFARMIAKIGLALAVAEFGVSAIAESYVTPAILGERDDIGRWVGSDNYVFELEKQGVTHAWTTLAMTWDHGGSRETLLIVIVKLFASAHSTGYRVVVGRANDGIAA